MLYLKEARLKKGYSQSEVARLLNISRQQYNNYELGKREPDFETILKMTEIFETTVEILFRGENAKKLPPKNRWEDIEDYLNILSDEDLISARDFIKFLADKKRPQV